MENLIDNINIILQRKGTLSEIIGKSKIKLVSYVGNFIPVNDIYKELKQQFDNIKTHYETYKSFDKLKTDFFDKYYVRYTFEVNGELIYCHYMYTTITKKINMTVGFYVSKLLDLPINEWSEGCIVLDESIDNDILISNLDDILIINIMVPFFTNDDYKQMSQKIVHDDSMFVAKLKSNIQGYGTIYMCLAAYFAYHYMNKKLFTLTASAQKNTQFTSEELINRYYPKFGFKSKKNNPMFKPQPYIMYAYLDEMIKNSRCIMLSDLDK